MADGWQEFVERIVTYQGTSAVDEVCRKIINGGRHCSSSGDVHKFSKSPLTVKPPAGTAISGARKKPSIVWVFVNSFFMPPDPIFAAQH
ncbi:MAG: hypothetical protein ACETWQ_03210 [Phycisphaerae bacterium]